MAVTTSRAWVLLQSTRISYASLKQRRIYSQNYEKEEIDTEHTKPTIREGSRNSGSRSILEAVIGSDVLPSARGAREHTIRSMKLTPPDLSRPAPKILPFEDKLAKKPERIRPYSWIKGSRRTLESANQDSSPSTMDPVVMEEDDEKNSSNKLPSKSDLVEAQGSDTSPSFHQSNQASEILPPQIHGVGWVKPSVFTTVKDLRAHRRDVAMRGSLIGFVPTMGALHEGHLDLMRAAARKCREVWVSVYVNPTQFGVNEDLSTYPSTWEQDFVKIQALNDELLAQSLGRVMVVFRPESPEVLYPYGVEGTSHVVINPELTQILEGSSRPTFFRGVTTVVTKLLNIVQPEYVFFGQKDIQQFAVIKRMIKEFHIPTTIQRVPTTREESGLAMSSRNAYLGRRRRSVAPILYHMLSKAKEVFETTHWSKRTRKLLIDTAMEVYRKEINAQERLEFTRPQDMVNFKLDYLSLADPDTLQEIPDCVGKTGAIMSLAIRFEPLNQSHVKSWEVLGINGDTTAVRLIDNMLLGVDEDSNQGSAGGVDSTDQKLSESELETN